HILILLLVVLLVFGASRLPNAARSLGRSMRIFKSEMDEMRTDNPEQNEPQAIEQQRAPQPNPTQQVNPAQQHNQNSNWLKNSRPSSGAFSLTRMSNTPQAARTAQRPRRRAFRRANQRPIAGAMSIVEHIQELRRRLIIAVIAILIGTILGYLWYGTNVGPLRSLGEILREPYCKLPSEVRFGAATGECRLLATGPFEMFLLRLKVGFIAGIVLSAPVWIGQIWGFITPGLKKNERRWAVSVSLVATLFFFFGAAL